MPAASDIVMTIEADGCLHNPHRGRWKEAIEAYFPHSDMAEA
jgi:hypothetical protein